MEYSNIFGDRKYRAHEILEQFCNRYYDNELYKDLIRFERQIKDDLNYRLEPFINLYKENDCSDVLLNDLPRLAEKFAGDFFETELEPNGKMRYPDYIIDIYDHKNIYVDAKCVAYIPRKSNDTDNPLVIYNNGCGQVYEAAKHILAFYNGEDDPFYLSFILYMYYNEDGYIEDVLFCPTIYAIDLMKFDWNDLSTVKFSLKAAKNSNITLSLPTFLKKMGMLTLDEKELLIATAAHNYIEKHPEEFNND